MLTERLRVHLLAITCMALSALAHAQEKPARENYPNRPIRFFVCCAPGGSADIVTRLLAQQLSDRVGQPVVVENRVGGSGLLANDLVSKAAPDGYTMVLLSGGHPVSAAVMKNIPFDPVESFSMVTVITSYPFTVLVARDSTIKSFPDLIARAKAQPGKITMAIGALGSLHHLLAELINVEGGVDTLIVPLRGAGQSVIEVMGGRIDVMVETITASLGPIKSGKLRALALTTPNRFALMPDVATIAETLPGLEVTSWLGLAIAPKTSRAIVDKLNREVRAVLEQPDVRQRLADLGGTATPSTPEEMRDRVEREVARWKRIVALKGIPLQ